MLDMYNKKNEKCVSDDTNWPRKNFQVCTSKLIPVTVYLFNHRTKVTYGS